MPDQSVAVVLIDLDGTIVDSAPGILAAMRSALAEMGLPQLDAAAERALIGPPFRETLPPHVGADRVEETVRRYRAHYVDAGGMLDVSPFAGIPEMLEQLKDAGRRLAVATSKAEPFAVRILNHLGLLDYFDAVCGDDVDGTRGSKQAVVARALAKLDRPDPGTCRMLGDRFHDVVGAAANSVSTFGAGWGYGVPGELAAAGALAVLDHPDRVPASVLDG